MNIAFKDIFPAEVCSVQGKPYLFTNLRVDRKSIPDGFHAYDVRDDDCDGQFWEIQNFVMVNHWGTIIGLEPVKLDANSQYWCAPEDSDPDTSSEGAFIGFTMEDQSDYVAWYHSLKSYAQAVQRR